VWQVSRTNIDIDDRLVAEVMNRYRLKSKREAVDLALRRLVGQPPTVAEVMELEGSGWDADLEEIRTSRRVEDL
jgi:Arc/MetJ family transcription regulator